MAVEVVVIFLNFHLTEQMIRIILIAFNLGRRPIPSFLFIEHNWPLCGLPQEFCSNKSENLNFLKPITKGFEDLKTRNFQCFKQI